MSDINQTRVIMTPEDIRLVVHSEREECAKLADRYAAVEHDIPRAEAARAVAAMIRQRGKQ